jgi:hypothetical protein
MIKQILEFLKDLFKSPTMFDQLEAHIIAGNPQTPADVEQLERGFYNKYQRDALWHFKE